MTKPALAAIVALALSIPLANSNAGAQGSSSSTVTAESKSQTLAPGVQTTFSAPQQASRTQTVQTGTAPKGWTTTHGTSGTRSTTETTATTVSTTATAPPGTTKTGAATTTTTTTKTADEMIVVTQSVPKVATGTGTKPAWQKFYDYIKLKSGQDGLPLTLTINNGNPSHPAFEAVHIFLSGQQLATEKDFKNGVLQLKMDGTLTAGGDNQLIIQAYGQPNAAISWKLTTPRAVITAVKPDTAGIGDSITITGKNFSNKKGVSQVWIGDKIATITSGNAKTLVATIPANALPGENKLTVAVGGIAAKVSKITIKSAAPELIGTDIYGAPPGYPITVTGKGFSPVQSENIVTVGGAVAQIVSSSPTSITFNMPELPNVWSSVVLSVKSKGATSKNTLNVQPSNRLLPTSQ
jgi:hypothetical protein